MESNNSLVATIIHEIKNTLRGEPHSFSEIRNMMDEARINETDFFEILLQHHRFLNESIVVLVDHESSVIEKQVHLERFLKLLEMHGHAEEETLYRSLCRHEDHDVKRIGLVGKDEHELAFRLVDELKNADYITRWDDDVDAKAEVLANLTANHLLEEEGSMFPIAKKALLPGEFIALSSDYLDLCEFHLDGESRVLAPTYLTWPLRT